MYDYNYFTEMKKIVYFLEIIYILYMYLYFDIFTKMGVYWNMSRGWGYWLVCTYAESISKMQILP